MHAAAEDQPAGVAVALQVTSECGDSEHGITGTWARREWLPGDGSKDFELLPCERVRSWSFPYAAGEVTK